MAAAAARHNKVEHRNDKSSCSSVPCGSGLAWRVCAKVMRALSTLGPARPAVSEPMRSSPPAKLQGAHRKGTAQADFSHAWKPSRMFPNVLPRQGCGMVRITTREDVFVSTLPSQLSKEGIDVMTRENGEQDRQTGRKRTTRRSRLNLEAWSAAISSRRHRPHLGNFVRLRAHHPRS